ncbi:MAG TPA: tripartite tricarboxylate transporter substrate binding protein [Xanthobacteraceae bacterium]|nr:tripartite tricarboxylate transporter substrate binding protein [Xanthobacteraceae bacterium]
MTRRAAISVLAAAAIAAAFTGGATAQGAGDYPNQKITIISGLAAGGGADLITRHFAAKLQDACGQSVVVVNRPGAGGNLGAGAAAQAKPDGYTLLVAPNVAFAGNLYLYKDVPYHPIKSFAPVTTLASLPFVFAVPPNSPVNSMADLLELIRKKDGKATYAANTTTAIMGIEYLLKLTDTRMTRVPYKALIDAVPDVAQGTLDLVFGDATFLLGQAKAGRVKLLAVSTRERSPSVPDLPTMRELGYSDFDITAWFAAYAPAGTPPAAIAKLEGWLNAAVASEDTRAYLARVATDPMPGSTARLKDMLAEEVVKWRKLMEIAKLEPQ